MVAGGDVGGRVSCGFIRDDLIGEFSEFGVSLMPGFGFEIGLLSQFNISTDKRQLQLLSEFSNERFIAVGRRAEMMIDMNDIQIERPVGTLTEFMKDAEQGHRVGAAAHGKEDGVGGIGGG